MLRSAQRKTLRQVKLQVLDLDMNTKLITPEYIRSIFINDIDVAGTMLHWFSKCSENDRKKLLAILEDFAVNSQGRERDCSLFLLASESKQISNKLIDDLIKEIGDIYSERESLFFTAIIMIRNCKRKDKLPFCKHVLEWSMLNKRIGIISIVIKCILVIGWKDSISEIVNYFMNGAF